MSAHDPFSPTSRRLPIPSPTAGRALRIYAEVPRYLPQHNAGAEHTMHAILRRLVELGWEARVGSVEHRGPKFVWDGVEVHSTPYDEQSGRHWAWTDVGITHLHGTRRAVAWARQGRPLVHLVHNHTQLAQQRVNPRDAALVVWNAGWIAAMHEAWTGPTMVVHPPVDPAQYATVNVDRFLCGTVTLINLAEVKGAKLFWRLAARRSDLPFLGVEGAYHLQVSAPGFLPNVEQDPTQVDMAPIYQRTRVLAMPSTYESWGRTAVEAMASGIPVIAAPTPGLVEALTSPTLGECGLFADADDDDGWIAALKLLDSPKEWDRYSALARQRSAELAAIGDVQMGELVGKLTKLATGESIR